MPRRASLCAWPCRCWPNTHTTPSPPCRLQPSNAVPRPAALGLEPRYVAALTHTDTYLNALVKLIQPHGHIAVIGDPATLDVKSLESKALKLSWALMFTRGMYQTPDLDAQQKFGRPLQTGMRHHRREREGLHKKLYLSNDIYDVFGRP